MSANLDKLAALISTQISFYGWTRETLAKRTGAGVRTVYGWLGATNEPTPTFRPKLEEALGWAPGKVSELLTSDIANEYELEDMQPPAPEPKFAAADLTDQELIAELARRLKQRD
ncbi:hypothetical protein [Sinomonas gamaensis]|uniref:hypothetical protein n=1 Tax=Sinomonas gamaensis TaxID=2565624 RepID=UPI0011099A1E|nr:hypothetical protein [Sinomonas gamaensis]